MPKLPIVVDNEFRMFLGSFNQSWSSAEMFSSIAIGQLLQLTDEETHLLTARMEFARKAGLIRELLKRHSHERSHDIHKALNLIQNESKRNVFAHSMMFSSENQVTFLERGWNQAYYSEVHTFTLLEFAHHVERFSTAVDQLRVALAIDQSRMGVFLQAAINAQSKPRKSPYPPIVST